MKFKVLDEKMRVYETAHDHCVMPGIFMVARLDGRSFTKLTRDICKFEVPFDENFNFCMTEVVSYLMKDCGFSVLYGYTQSDEISLLFLLDEQAFGRKLRKYNSILAGEASAKISTLLGTMAVFDCRICQLPNRDTVIDYFRWRQEDAHRNALQGYCYWTLCEDGCSARKATSILYGKSVSDQNEFLFSKGINFNDYPAWQKRGVGLYWESYKKQAINPKTQEVVWADRRRLYVNKELPMGEGYTNLIRYLLLKSYNINN